MPSSTTLSHLPRLSLYPLVIITHNIYTSEWDERTEEVLLTWYIRDYWSTLEFREGIPQFLIFLNIEYTREKPVSWIQKLFRRRRLTKQRIVKQLLHDFRPSQIYGQSNVNKFHREPEQQRIMLAVHSSWPAFTLCKFIAIV